MSSACFNFSYCIHSTWLKVTATSLHVIGCMMHHCGSSISCKCWCYVLYMGHVLVYTCTTCADLLLITQIRHAGMEFWFKATIITIVVSVEFVVKYLNTRSRRVAGSHENVGEIVVVVHENDAETAWFPKLWVAWSWPHSDLDQCNCVSSCTVAVS